MLSSSLSCGGSCQLSAGRPLHPTCAKSPLCGSPDGCRHNRRQSLSPAPCQHWARSAVCQAQRSGSNNVLAGQQSYVDVLNRFRNGTAGQSNTAADSSSTSEGNLSGQAGTAQANGEAQEQAAALKRVVRQRVKLPDWAIQRAAKDSASAGVATEEELQHHVTEAMHQQQHRKVRPQSPSVRHLKHGQPRPSTRSQRGKFAALTEWADLAASRLSDPASDASLAQAPQEGTQATREVTAQQQQASVGPSTSTRESALKSELESGQGARLPAQSRSGQRQRSNAQHAQRSPARVTQRSSSATTSRPDTPASQPKVPSAARWRLFGVDIPLEDDPGKDHHGVHDRLCAAVSKRLGCRGGPLSPDAITVVRKSFDARKGKPKKFSYVVDVDVGAAMSAGAARQYAKPGHMEGVEAEPLPSRAPGNRTSGPAAAAAPHPRRDPVVVVGSGPAGLFAALTAAEAGLPVVLLERGQPVESRGRDIGALFVRRQLNPESNLCYGEGGAGTWSDGKLTTRIGRNSDPVRRVLHTLYQMGAPEEILVAGKPHLGTDRLVRILKAFRAHLAGLGVDIRFGTQVTDIMVNKGHIVGVQLAGGEELRAAAVVLAVGHSSRPVYAALLRKGAQLTPKPFAVGFRVEHPQALIDAIQYGQADAAEVQRGKGRLPVADYRLAADVPAAASPSTQSMHSIFGTDASTGTSFEAPLDDTSSRAHSAVQDPSMTAEPSGRSAPGNTPSMRSVFSFCMCPGGQIVPTSISPDELCLNGMSFSRRNSVWANAALVVGVDEPDWAPFVDAHGPLAGMQLQVEAEREAARRGGGNYVAPVQRVTDFMAGQASQGQLPSSSYRLGTRSAPLHDLYSPAITAALRCALERFDRRLPGFLSEAGLLHGVETRTSAPVRIDRDDETQSTTLQGLYPCGEGAGYAGGIVSAAVDGLRVGEAIVAQLSKAELLL